jgi:glycosyltransferase involved in cell wall biosynthesis
MKICIANTQEINPMIGGIERVSTLLAQEWLKTMEVCFLSQYPSNYVQDYTSIAPSCYLPQREQANCTENVDYFVDFITKNKIDILLNQAANSLDFSQLCVAVKNRTSVKLISALHFAPNSRIEIILSYFFMKARLHGNLLLWTKELFRYIYYCIYAIPQLEKKESVFFKFVHDNSDAVVLLSNSYKAEFLRKINVRNSSKLLVIRNCLCPVKKGTDKKIKKILYVGRLELGQKRVDRLIDIWSSVSIQFPDWSLYIVGDGHYRKPLEDFVIKKKIERVVFEGFKDPYPYYDDSPILCMTSTSEGLPMVLIEAQQFGCVPIAYDSFGAVRDIIEDGINGYLATPFHKKEYIRKLKYLMDNEDIRTSMSKQGMSSCEKFEVKEVSKEWIKLFHALLTK